MTSVEESRTILVTGAAGGIGRAICEEFAAEAWQKKQPLKLVLHGSKPSQSLTDLVNALSKQGVVARAFYADLTDAKAAKGLITAAVIWAGRLDVLVSNAGRSRPGALANMDVDDWDACLDLNLRATWILAKTAHSALVASRGNIVAVTSMSGLHPHPGYGAYSSAKAGLTMLCRQFAQEWAADGIRANAVCPGMIRTPLTESVYLDATVKQQREALVPLGRIGTPADIAHAVVFLAGEKASYITGANLLVDGGISDSVLSRIPGRPDKQTT